MSSATFEHTGWPSRIVFGSGTIARVGEEVDRLGRSRALVLASGSRRGPGDAVTAALGERAVGRFDGAVMHTPVEVTEQALVEYRRTGADVVVAVGGGSVIGLAKAIAVRTGADQVILPTTYSGSEVTPVTGESTGGQKTTRSGPELLPETVIYDLDLSRGLPPSIAVPSAVNAMAHAVEALYSVQANPLVDLWALDAIDRLARGVGLLGADEGGDDARRELLLGAWLAGTCLASAGMGLHHKLCHVLGGSFGLDHASTHTVVLPHAMAYNAAATGDVMQRIGAVLGVSDAPRGVQDLVIWSGGPTSLRSLGLTDADLDHAADLAVATPYPNPVDVTRAGVRDLLARALDGHAPRVDDRPTPGFTYS